MFKKLFRKKDKVTPIDKQLIDLAFQYLNLAEMPYIKNFKNFTAEERRKLYAFELGIMEYILSEMMNISDEIQSTQFNLVNSFLHQFAKIRYNEPEIVVPIYQKMLAEELYLRERELGFNAINNHSNPDGSKNESHWPANYYKKALFGDTI